jgi:hypothetical protein
MYWNSQYFSNGSGLSCNVCPAHLQFAEGDDGSQIRVSILSPRADISLETGAGNTLVKRKKGGFQNLSGQKSDLLSVSLLLLAKSKHLRMPFVY